MDRVAVEVILQSAERAATDIRRETQIWVRQRLDETRRPTDGFAALRAHVLSSILGDLLARTQAVTRASEALIELLEDPNPILDDAGL